MSGPRGPTGPAGPGIGTATFLDQRFVLDPGDFRAQYAPLEPGAHYVVVFRVTATASASPPTVRCIVTPDQGWGGRWRWARSSVPNSAARTAATIEIEADEDGDSLLVGCGEVSGPTFVTVRGFLLRVA